MKVKKYYIFSVMSLISLSSYAAHPTNLVADPVDQKMFYCPETVTCTKFNDPSSCTYKTDNLQIWGELKYNEFILNNTYKLDSVSAPYHSSEVEPVSCTYTVDGYNNYQLFLSSKKEANLEVYYGNPSNWKFTSSDNPYQANCTTLSRESNSCPLKEQSAVIFYNVNIGSGVIASINNTVISNAQTSQYKKVNYETALNYCRGVRECRINFESSDRVFYGDVTVDMYNGMKILKVSSITPLARIDQIGIYNAVEVKASFDHESH